MITLPGHSQEFRVSPVFLANQKAFKRRKYKYIVNQGGTRSGKTYSILQLLILIAQFFGNLEISVVSKTLPHLKKGAIRDFKKIMIDLGIWNEKRFNKTDLIYKFPNGTFIEFFSADNAEKLRGPGRDILFVNECNLLTWDEFTQLDLRTRMKAFIDYNPVDEFHWIYEKIIPLPDAYFVKSTYMENYDFLPNDQIRKIEALKHQDENLWRIFGEGEIAQAVNLIYSNYEIKPFSSIHGDTIYGLDFGFNAPTALVKLTNWEQTIYVEEKLYETGLTNSDLIKELETIIGSSNDYIYADSAEPGRIEEIHRAGFNIMPADKAVKPGIDFMKRFKLIVHPSAINVQKELKTYKFKEDKNGHILDEPVKWNDHSMDAKRYAGYTHGMQYWITDNTMILPSSSSSQKRMSSKPDKYAGYKL